jgi:hypothetical protein
MTYDEASDAASRHRAQFGDDVILHSPDDEGSFFACEDCNWTCVYDPDPEWDAIDTADSAAVGEAATND